MKIINATIFLMSISLTTLIFPSMIDSYTIILTGLLIFGIMLNFLRLSHINPSDEIPSLSLAINYNNIFVPLLALLFLSVMALFLSFYELSSPIAFFGLILMHTLFLFFIMNTRGYIFIYIKSYVTLVFIMALCGLLANFLLAYEFINYADYYVSLSRLTNGSFTRDAGEELGSYSFPYYLGLILTGPGKLSLLGFEFYRISGWSNEPSTASLFIAPAMLILGHSNIIINKFFRFTMLFTIFIFWLFCMSIGSLLAFVILYIILIYSYLISRYFPFKLTFLSFFAILTVLFLIIAFTDQLFTSTLLSSKFSSSSETMSQAINELYWFAPLNSNSPELFHFTHLFLWAIILTFIASISSLMLINNNLNVFALIIFYIVLQSMKGFQEMVFLMIFTFFWFYISYFSLHEDAVKSFNTIFKKGSNE